METKKSLKLVEKKLGHKLDLVAGGKRNTGVDDFDGHPSNYFVPNFGVDADIVQTQKNIKMAEKENKHKIDVSKIAP